MQEFINDFCSTIARIIKIEEEREGETNEKKNR